MQRTYTKPADNKECRPKIVGEVIIENLKKDGDVIGIEAYGEKRSVEKLCRHEECQYCENCPMHLAIELQRVDAYFVQCELMVYFESLECPLAVVMLDEFLDPKQNTPEELSCHEFVRPVKLLSHHFEVQSPFI